MTRLISALWAVCIVCVLSIQPLAAQDSQDDPGGQLPDYVQWASTAERAEEAIEAARASDTALEALREQIVVWRSEFNAAQAANRALIAIQAGQIEALGPKPEDGVEEEFEITARRGELANEMARLQAPVLRAEEAFSRADGLISEIDRIIRERQTNELISLGPSPVNPGYWGNALTDLRAGLRGVVSEVRSAWDNPIQRSEFLEELPVILTLLLISGALISRGRTWVRLIAARLRKRFGAGFGVWSFAISLGLIAVPLIGVVVLSEALFSANLLGLRGSFLLSLVPSLAVYLFGFGWLAERMFPTVSQDEYLLLSDDNRARMRRLTWMMAATLVGYSVLRDFVGFERYSAQTTSVLLFPMILLTSLILFRMAQIFLLAGGRVGGEGDEPGIRSQLVRFLALALIGVAVVGPVMAAIGYGAAANVLVYSSVLSLGLLGVLQVLTGFIGDLYGMITKRPEGAREALVPVLLSFVLTLATVPLFALIWGARVATLTELWTQFKTGFQIGGAQISPASFLTFAVLFTVGYLVTRLLQSGLRGSILPKTRIDSGGQNAIVSGTGYIGIFLAAIVAISGAGIDLGNIAIVAGALSVGIGFGLQTIVSNFVSGIILLIERPISEGDWIEVGGTHGTVRNISVRSTRIETFDRSDVIVPNSDLISGKVTNYTRGKTVGRVIVPVGVAYGNDTRRVEKLLLGIAQNHPMTLSSPAPYVVFQGFGADSLDFEIRAILRDVNYVLSVRSEMNHEIARVFTEEGIEIPFAQRDITIKNIAELKAATHD